MWFYSQLQEKEQAPASSTAVGKAAGCAFISSKPSSKCSLHLTALQSWISPQRAGECVLCRQGDVSDKTRHEEGGDNVLLPVPCWNPWVLQPPRGQLAVLLLSPALWWWWQVIFCVVLGCGAWHGCGAEGNRAGMGYKEKQIIPTSLWSVCFFLSLCSGRNAVAGTSGDQLWSSPAPSALQGGKGRMFSSPYTSLDARMDAQPKRLL